MEFVVILRVYIICISSVSFRNCISGVIVSVLALIVVDRGFWAPIGSNQRLWNLYLLLLR